MHMKSILSCAQKSAGSLFSLWHSGIMRYQHKTPLVNGLNQPEQDSWDVNICGTYEWSTPQVVKAWISIPSKHKGVLALSSPKHSF